MMSALKRMSLAAGLLAWTAVSGVAEPGPSRNAPIEIDFRVIRVSAAAESQAGARVFSGETFSHLVESGQIQVLDSQTVSGQLERSQLMMQGSKIPLTYLDPRANMYQVQYVDVGIKADTRVAESSGGLLRVDVNLERSALTGEGGAAPSSDAMRNQTVCLLRPGQVGVVYAVQGKLTGKYLKSIYPNVTFSEHDTVELAISVRKL